MNATPSSRQLGQGCGKKSVALVAAAGYLKPQDVVWAAIRQLKTFTQLDIELKLVRDNITGINSWTVKSYISRLEKGGFIKLSSYEPVNNIAKRITYTLINDVGVHSPRLNKDGEISTQGRGRENLWRAMKVLGTFDQSELSEAASTKDVIVKEGEAQDYIKHLYKAEYLIKTAKYNRKTGTKARYQLLKSKNTGALPPMVQRTKHIFDQNLKKIVWQEKPKEGFINE